MAKNTNAKKIEKLRQKIDDIDKRIKSEVEQKQQLQKEIEALEADSILSACREKNFTLSEAVESFEYYKLIKSSGISIEEISELLSAESDKPDTTQAQTDNDTLSPMDTKL